MTPKKSANTSTLAYVRKSQARSEAAVAGLERQEQDIRRYCEQHGLTLVEVRSEVQSAYAEKKRPVWTSCLKDLAAGTIGNLVVWRLDRASRRGIAGLAEVITAVEKTGGILHSVTEALDLSSPMGRGVAGILASVAEQESENTSTRVKRAVEAQVAEGRRHSGARQFGWDKGGEPIPEEFELIREAGRRVMAGESLRKIALDWNARKIPSAKGNVGRWNSESFRSMLLSPTMRGVRTHNGVEFDGNFPHPFTVEEHSEVLAAMPNRSKGKGNQTLLAGLDRLFCGKCGQPLRSGGSSTGKDRQGNKTLKSPRYMCQSGPSLAGCGGISVSQPGVDEIVETRILEMLTVTRTRPDVDDTRANLETEIEAVKLSLKEITSDRYVARKISDEVFEPAYKELTSNLKALEDRLGQVPEDTGEKLPAPKAAAKWWSTATREQKRNVISDLIEKIEVLPQGRTSSNRFNKDRVNITPNTKWLWAEVHKAHPE